MSRPNREANLRFNQLFSAVALLGALLPPAIHAQAPGGWTRAAPMPSERTEVAVAEVLGKTHVAGGFGGERELEIFDPATDRWSRGGPIPRPVHHAGLVGWQGKL